MARVVMEVMRVIQWCGGYVLSGMPLLFPCNLVKLYPHLPIEFKDYDTFTDCLLWAKFFFIRVL